MDGCAPEGCAPVKMNPTINQVVFDLLEAEVTLYPANADGTPQLANPVWTGAPAERLTARAAWIKQETRPTGAKHPRHHPLIPQYQIEIGRVWLIDDALAPTGFESDYNQYVLDVVWTDADSGQWHRKTFYGVTISEQGWEARDVESGLMEDQQFDAKYYTASSGGIADTVPDISNALPYYVRYTDPNESVMLYTYDPATKRFTAVNLASLRATIGYEAGSFAIRFAPDFNVNGNGAFVLVVSTTGSASLAYRIPAIYRNVNSYRQQALVVNGGIFTGVPNPNQGPRLDFFYGAQRIATVTRDGVYEVDYEEASMPSEIPDGAFAILCGGSLVALIEAGSLTATQFQVSA